MTQPDHHQPVPPPVSEGISRRACDQWIRDALKEQKASVETIQADVDAMRTELKEFVDCALGSIPGKDPKAHLTAHERLEQENKEREKRRLEDEKLRMDVRNGIIKTVVNVILVAAAGVVMLGVQAQFGIWVNNVRAPAAEAAKTGSTK